MYWIDEEFDPKHLYPNKRKSRITAFIIDETQIQIGPNEAWLWVAVEEPIYYRFLGICISRHREIANAESFLRSLVKLYGKQIEYIQMKVNGILKLVSVLGLSIIIERPMKYVKDRMKILTIIIILAGRN